MPKRRKLLPHGLLLAMLISTVLVPAALALTVGVIALAIYSDAFDIVFGVLVLTFGGAAIAGSVVGIVFVRRSAKLAELQADFVANVSHELRTPLAGIRLVAETLEAGRGDDPERLAELTEMLGDEVRRLEDLVERVLAWRSLDGQSSEHPPELVAVSDLVDGVVASIRRLPEARGVIIGMSVPDELPALRGDREALHRALHNLVHNAVKFGGEDGPVELDVSEHDGMLHVAVSDHGPGIEPDDHKRIFERFVRSLSHRVRGTGLGLDIARTIALAHGGRIDVDSDLGHGSTFTLALPASAASASETGEPVDHDS